MDPATFIVPAATSFTVETGGTTINGVVTYSVLLPHFPQTLLLSTTEYTARIKTTAKDLAGCFTNRICMEIHNWCSTCLWLALTLLACN
jgi:hypothetical protein